MFLQIATPHEIQRKHTLNSVHCSLQTFCARCKQFEWDFQIVSCNVLTYLFIKSIWNLIKGIWPEMNFDLHHKCVMPFSLVPSLFDPCDAVGIILRPPLYTPHVIMFSWNVSCSTEAPDIDEFIAVTFIPFYSSNCDFQGFNTERTLLILQPCTRCIRS